MRKELRGFIQDWRRNNKGSYGCSLFVARTAMSWVLKERIFDYDRPEYYFLKEITKEEAIELVRVQGIKDLWGDLDE